LIKRDHCSFHGGEKTFFSRDNLGHILFLSILIRVAAAVHRPRPYVTQVIHVHVVSTCTRSVELGEASERYCFIAVGSVYDSRMVNV
jgi:hypothetical protein